VIKWTDSFEIIVSDHTPILLSHSDSWDKIELLHYLVQFLQELNLLF